MRLSLFRIVILAALVAGSTTAFPASAWAQPDEEGELDMDEPPADEGGLEVEGEGTVGEGEINMDEPEPEPTADPTQVPTNLSATTTPIAWQDILTVIRKPFLKVRRTALRPMFATTMNDNMVRHYGFGGELSYFLSDSLAVGVEGQYFIKQFREPFDLVARQARRLPTVNQYNFSAALNFHYVPVYGKFAVFDKRLITWEAYFTAGIGMTQSEVIPRDTRFPGFTNFLISPNVGASLRFFLFKWMTVDLGVRDYIFIDKFEPADRSPTMNATADQAKDNADSSLINNVMFQMGVSFWIPTSFEYTTFR